jgi:CelD/BcsL family acetyltransferase involved in cellulose biosynthesis
LFLIPLAIYRKGLVTELGFLGRDLCDYNAPLLAPRAATAVTPHFTQVWRSICERLQREPQGRHDLIMLDRMPARIGVQPNPFLALSINLHPSGAYLTSLTDDWETFYSAKRSSATRRRDRTKRKRLAENGAVQTVTPHASDDIAATLAVLIEQKQRSFARMGVANMFARPGYCAFFYDLATNPRTHGLVHVSRLQVGPTPAATNLGLVFRGGYYHVLASYDDGPLSKFGPGSAHLHDLMGYAIERGCAFFDFTIGDEGYKRDWSDTEMALYDHIAGVTWRGRAVAGLLSAARRAKRGIKQSERLWPLVARLRARLAGGRQT